MTPICLNSPKVFLITPNRNLNSPKVIFVTLGVIFPNTGWLLPNKGWLLPNKGWLLPNKGPLFLLNVSFIVRSERTRSPSRSDWQSVRTDYKEGT